MMGIRPLLMAKIHGMHNKQSHIIYAVNSAGKVTTWLASIRGGISIYPYIKHDDPAEFIIHESYKRLVQALLVQGYTGTHIAPGVLFRPLEKVNPL